MNQRRCAHLPSCGDILHCDQRQCRSILWMIRKVPRELVLQRLQGFVQLMNLCLETLGWEGQGPFQLEDHQELTWSLKDSVLIPISIYLKRTDKRSSRNERSSHKQTRFRGNSKKNGGGGGEKK